MHCEKKSFLLYVLLKVRSARGGMGGGEGPPYSCGSVRHTIGSLVDMPQHLGCEPWPITRQGRGSRCRAPLPPRGKQGTRYSELCFSTSRIQEMKWSCNILQWVMYCTTLHGEVSVMCNILLSWGGKCTAWWLIWITLVPRSFTHYNRLFSFLSQN